ncbi:MAG: hypothetical protein JWO08_3908, partial [Verrucomicrobiaceae bacterium]|nr:hypothetical protein [Verrucomicrobiaceae bacterium]
ARKAAADDKPSAAMFDQSLLMRIAADLALPSSLSLAFDSAEWLQGDRPRYVAFLGFGKKKDKPADGSEEAPKEEPKPEPKKKEPKPEPEKAEKPKAESPKPKAKKERLVSVSIPLSDYDRIIKRSDSKKILNATATNIASLVNRAHPLFRPLLKQYNELVLDLASHKTKDADARIKELRARRDQVLAQAKGVRDHLDWFEASVSNEYSGLFDDYLRLPKTIDQEIPRRTDAISKTLDEVEKQAEK